MHSCIRRASDKVVSKWKAEGDSSQRRSANGSLQFGIRQLLLVTFVYAFLFAWFGTLPISATAFAAAIRTVTMFLIADLGWSGARCTLASAWSRVALFAARYSTAFSLAAFVCLWAHFAFPVPQTAPTASDGPFLIAELREAFKPLAIALCLYLAFLAFGVVGFVTAAIAAGQSRQARWYLLLSAPAIAGVGWSVVEVWRGGS
jgi:hypothetical protein